MQMRLPETYIDAKQAIEESLEGNKLIIGKYGSLLANLCDVIHYHVQDVENKEGLGNLTLLLTYKVRIINKYNKFEEVKKSQTLKVLTTKGDKIWPYSIVIKVWEGNYPSGVAVNEETGQIYLLNLRMSGLELVSFSTFTEEELAAFKEDLNEVAPYRITLNEDAMFDYIAGLEGNRHLKETLSIEFDCGVKIRKKAEESVGV